MQNLRHYRAAKKLSQAQLAEAAGIAQGTVSKLERGEMNPTMEMIDALAGALKIAPFELFDMPELQARVLAAISSMDEARQEAALVVLETMATAPKPGH